MDPRRKALYIVIILLSSGMCLHGAQLEESIINKDLTGQELIKMGSQLNKPLLALLGTTIMKMEKTMDKNLSDKIGVAKIDFKDGFNKLKSELCKETRCAAWTGWSRCSAYTTGTFGARTRTRKCGGNSSICSMVSAETVEKDNQICQGPCQHTLTTNKFCIKLNKDEHKSQKDASEECHKEGGHLMNMDSEVKFKDVDEYFTSISFTSNVWLDGSRTLPNGDWKYEYGSNDTSFSIWRSGEPGSTDDCRVYSSNKKWYGRLCTGTYFFLCEILE